MRATASLSLVVLLLAVVVLADPNAQLDALKGRFLDSYKRSGMRLQRETSRLSREAQNAARGGIHETSLIQLEMMRKKLGAASAEGGSADNADLSLDPEFIVGATPALTRAAVYPIAGAGYGFPSQPAVADGLATTGARAWSGADGTHYAPVRIVREQQPQLLDDRIFATAATANSRHRFAYRPLGPGSHVSARLARLMASASHAPLSASALSQEPDFASTPRTAGLSAHRRRYALDGFATAVAAEGPAYVLPPASAVRIPVATGSPAAQAQADDLDRQLRAILG